MGRGRRGRRRKEVENAGCCLFKTRTQHHRMVGKYRGSWGLCLLNVCVCVCVCLWAPSRNAAWLKECGGTGTADAGF
eukprot:8301115-Pyramimonas_sp.AAC.1